MNKATDLINFLENILDVQKKSTKFISKSSVVKVLNLKFGKSHLESAEFLFEQGNYVVRLYVLASESPDAIMSKKLIKSPKQKLLNDINEYVIKIDGFDLLTKTIYSKPIWSFTFNKQYGIKFENDTEALYHDFNVMVNRIRLKGLLGLKFLNNAKGWTKSMGSISSQEILDGLKE
jgi:hypothetical protein